MGLPRARDGPSHSNSQMNSSFVLSQIRRSSPLRHPCALPRDAPTSSSHIGENGWSKAHTLGGSRLRHEEGQSRKFWLLGCHRSCWIGQKAPPQVDIDSSATDLLCDLQQVTTPPLCFLLVERRDLPWSPRPFTPSRAGIPHLHGPRCCRRGGREVGMRDLFAQRESPRWFGGPPAPRQGLDVEGESGRCVIRGDILFLPRWLRDPATGQAPGTRRDAEARGSLRIQRARCPITS